MKSSKFYTSRRHRQWPRRRLLYAGFFGVITTLLCTYFVIFSHHDALPSLASSAQSSTPLSLPKNIQLTWPVNGQAAIGSVEDGLLARSSDSENPRPTASMAKVITALAIMKKQPFTEQSDQTYTITAKDIASMNAYIAEDGSVLPLRIGEQLTQYQAMQRMLIASDNNMADILTERIFGSQQAYVVYANTMLRSMGLKQTIVADASGFDSATVSTPSELVAIGIAALKNPVITEIVAQQQAQVPNVGTITNTNQLLGTDGVTGIKTGTTDQAGSCLLFAARYVLAKDKTERTIVGVIMGDISHERLYADSSQLLASARQEYSLVQEQATTDINSKDRLSPRQ